MRTNDEATELVSALSQQWADALRDRRYEWFEIHLAEDFLFSAHPFPELRLRKREFIEVDKKIAQAGRYIGYAGSMATMIFPLWTPDRMRAYALSASLKGKT
jgi:hypothetical protein